VEVKDVGGERHIGLGIPVWTEAYGCNEMNQAREFVCGVVAFCFK